MTLFFLAKFLVGSVSALAAVTSTLDHPDRDVKRLFPESTTYKVRELIPFRHGAKNLATTLATELGYELDREFETPETPYTFYAVYKSGAQIGLIIGNNSRFVNGPLQVFVAYERNGKIRDFIAQKISSDDATAFRSKYYRQQFKAFGINGLPEDADLRPPIRSPSNTTIKDHHSFIRAIRFNILIVKHLYNKFKE